MARYSNLFYLIGLLVVLFGSTRVSAKPINLEGIIVNLSALPLPEKSDYPDCNYTAMFQVENILSQDSSIPEKIVLVIPGFRKRKLLTDSIYSSGQRLKVKIELFDDISETLRQIQQADQINSLDYDYYYLYEGIKIEPIGTVVQLPTESRKNALTHSTTSIDINKLTPQRGNADKLRKQAIQKDLARINKLLSKNGGDFKKWYDNLNDVRREYGKVIEKKDFKWIGDSYFSLKSWALYKEEYLNYDFVSAMIDYNQYLRDRNIDFIVVRVPSMNEVVGDLFIQSFNNTEFNPYLQKFNKILLENDVETIDLVPPLVKNRFKYPLLFWYQTTDPHPAEGAGRIIARELTDRLKRYNFKAVKTTTVYLVSTTMFPFRDDIYKCDYTWPDGNIKYDTSSAASFLGVFSQDGNVLQINENSGSPVLFIGDSFVDYSPNNIRGGSIPQYFYYESGVLPDKFCRYGGATNLFGELIRKGDSFLVNRRVVIFIMNSGGILKDARWFMINKNPKAALSSVNRD